MDVIRCAELLEGRLVSNDAYMPGPVHSERRESGTGIQHLRWMCEQIMYGEITDEKAHRWIGYIQGMGVAFSLWTLEEMKELNRSA